jgi:hypothetical protein
MIPVVSAVSGKLFHRVVKCKNVAPHAAQQRDGNFKDRYETMIVGTADGTIH